jgi:hypothetical protein
LLLLLKAYAALDGGIVFKNFGQQAAVYKEFLREQFSDVIKKLKERGVSINQDDYAGHNALYYALKAQALDAITVLLEIGGANAHDIQNSPLVKDNPEVNALFNAHGKQTEDAIFLNSKKNASFATFNNWATAFLEFGEKFKRGKDDLFGSVNKELYDVVVYSLKINTPSSVDDTSFSFLMQKVTPLMSQLSENVGLCNAVFEVLSAYKERAKESFNKNSQLRDLYERVALAAQDHNYIPALGEKDIKFKNTFLHGVSSLAHNKAALSVVSVAAVAGILAVLHRKGYLRKIKEKILYDMLERYEPLTVEQKQALAKQLMLIRRSVPPQVYAQEGQAILRRYSPQDRQEIQEILTRLAGELAKVAAS